MSANGNTPEHFYDAMAEQAVCGGLLIDGHRIKRLSMALRGEHFFMLRHRLIYEAALSLHTKGQDVDYVTIAGELKHTGKLADVGGMPYLTELIDKTPTAWHIDSHAQSVIQAHRRMKLAALGDEISAAAKNPKLTMADIASDINKKVYDATGAVAIKPIPAMKDLVKAYWDKVERLMKNPDTLLGLPTGFKNYDNLLLGWQPSDLILVAGRPGMGKSAFILCAALNALEARPEINVVYFSLEMPDEQIVQRAAAIKSNINLQTLRSGKFSPQEYKRFVSSLGDMANMNLFVDDTSGLKPSHIRAKCQQVKDVYGRVDLIIVDYLQLADPEVTTKNHVVDVGTISKALKDIAREFNVPVVAGAQLSRAVEQRSDKRPILSDLRESGTLEQDADIVTFLYRDEVYNETTEHPNTAELITAKHRNGPVGTIYLYFEKTLTKFLNAA